MAKKDNIIKSTSKHGYNLSRASYDVRQKLNAKVIGVLKYNNVIREKLLKRNIGKYTFANLDEGIGYISNLYSLENNKPLSLGEDGLLGYTHIYTSDYQKKINNKYDIGDFFQYYKHGSLPDNNLLKWQGLYDDYTAYINETYGLRMSGLNMLGEWFHKKFSGIKGLLFNEGDITIQSVLYDLQYNDMKYTMEKNRIGVIKPDPLTALSGTITTNINNLGGKDTPLGMITNQLYAQTLQNAAYFNTFRKTKYITPSAYEMLGVKLNTISTIGSDFRIDEETGRLAFDLTNDTSTYYDAELSSNEYQINNLVKPLGAYTSPTISGKIYKIWNEGDRGNSINEIHTWNTADEFKSINDSDKTDGLLNKTQQLFNSRNEQSIDTIVGRFHTSGNIDKKHNEASLLQTAVTSYGMSHGRNLLTLAAYRSNISNKTNGYSNPYCRTWTYHNQYEKINNLIRPFGDESGIKDTAEVQYNWWQFGRRKGSAERLRNNSSLNNNGFVNITPTNENDGLDYVDIRNCMFSIENLAWKDVKINENDIIKPLSKEQIGPNGGRIMWFPPYDLKFNENVSVNWSPNEFIGRGEKIYTYTNTDRSGTLSFIMLVDHPSILDMWKNNGATQKDEDDEQSLLRFFAGCSLLELNNKKIQTTQPETVPENNTTTTPIIENEETEDIVFYIFFPNNYSGDTIPGNRDPFVYLGVEYECLTDGNIVNLYPDYKWEYPVDEGLLTEKLEPETNYKNTKNFGLNYSLAVVRNNGFTDATHSYNDILINFYKISGNKTVTKATVQGFASGHGTTANNTRLIEKRATFASNFLKNKLGVTCKIEPQKGVIVPVDNKDSRNISGKSAKCGRCARVTLTLKGINSITTLQDSNTPTSSTDNSNDISEASLTSNTSLKEEKRNERRYSNDPLYNIGVQIYKDTIINTKEGNSLLSQWNNSTKVLSIDAINVNKKESEENTDEVKEQRWDEEAQYFTMLKNKDVFTYNKIIDKIKYFTPAFHSITPEGFNSRLGFLHQCTRQGNTCGTSDGNTINSAGNMAFGRPPICVLRIGDFYHTKITIDSLTIDYENQQWDLNPEGIGIQPMFARISLNFHFLGGSDLEAPISRLQNALSFNYYANQSIYDDRADIGFYNDNKKPTIKGTPWKPF